MLGFNQVGSTISQVTKPTISEKSLTVGAPVDIAKAEDSPGVGKLLVGPNGPVDEVAAAKVVAAGTMPINSVKLQPIVTPVYTQKTEKSSVIQQHATPKQIVLRCDCCSVTVNSQHQLDLHLNGIFYNNEKGAILIHLFYQNTFYFTKFFLQNNFFGFRCQA